MRTRNNVRYTSGKPVHRPVTGQLSLLKKKKTNILSRNISLRKFGYSTKSAPEIRKLAIIKSVLKFGYPTILDRMEKLRDFNIDTRNRTYFSFKNDVLFIKSVWGDSYDSMKNVIQRKFTNNS
jgi:hypothetical protein